MAIASASAIPINIAGKILPEASGFRPIASIALKPIKPIAIAGPKPPTAIAAPLAKIISKKVHHPFSHPYHSEPEICRRWRI